MLPFLALSISVALALQEPETGIPGDEGPLRNQAFVPRADALVRAKLEDGEKAIAAGETARGFSLLRQACADVGSVGSRLVALSAEAEGRLLTDLTAHLRRRAACLTAGALDTYLTDAESAAAVELPSGLPLATAVVRAARFPRTRSAAQVLSQFSGDAFSRGDLAGARAAAERALSSGSGTPEERASLALLAAVAAREMGDEPAGIASAGDLAASIPFHGQVRTLAEHLAALAERGKPGAAIRSLTELWRVALPPSSEPANIEPVERRVLALESGFLVQTAAELLWIAGDDGSVRARFSLRALGGEAAAAGKPRDGGRKTVQIGLSADPDAFLIFPGRRRALPAADGRFIAITVGGVLAAFEVRPGEPQELRLLWSRAGNVLRGPDGKPIGKAPAESQPAEPQADDPSVPPPVPQFADGALLIGGRLFAASFLAGEDTTTSIEAFDPRTGERIFQRLLAKGSVLRSSDEPRRAMARTVAVLPSPLVYSAGRVMISTELGVVASVDPLDGEVEYLLRTQRAKEPSGYEWSAPAAGAGVTVLAPSDSDYLYALRPRLTVCADGLASWPLPFAFDGAPQDRRPRVRETRYARLVGARGSRAFLLNPRPRTGQSLRAFDFATRIPEERELAPGETALGMPALLEHFVALPTDHGITLYESGGGLTELTQIPLRLEARPGGWLPSQILGDLSAVPEGVISCTATHLTLYRAVR